VGRDTRSPALPDARLHTVAAAGHLPTANDGGLSSCTRGTTRHHATVEMNHGIPAIPARRAHGLEIAPHDGLSGRWRESLADFRSAPE